MTLHMALSVLTLILVLFWYYVNYYTFTNFQYEQVWGKQNYDVIHKFQMKQIQQMVDYYKTNPDALNKGTTAPASTGNTPAASTGNTPAASTGNTPLTQDEITSLKKDYPILWNKNAKISWIEYSDLECPYCKKLHESGVYSNISKSMGENINYVFKHFPLSIHPGSEKKHEGLECVQELAGGDVYYKLQEKIYAKNSYQQAISQDDLIALAGELWVKKDNLTSCIDSGKTKDKIEASISEGKDKFHIDGTPAVVVINNQTWAYQFVSGARWQSDFEAAIKAVTPQ